MKTKIPYIVCVAFAGASCGDSDTNEINETTMEPEDNSTGQDPEDVMLGSSGVEAEKPLAELDENEYTMLCEYATPRIFLSEQTSIFCYDQAFKQSQVDDALVCETEAQRCIDSPESIMSFVDCSELNLEQIANDCSIDVTLVETCADGYKVIWDQLSPDVDCSNVMESLSSLDRMIPFECRVIDTMCPTLFGIN